MGVLKFTRRSDLFSAPQFASCFLLGFPTHLFLPFLSTLLDLYKLPIVEQIRIMPQRELEKSHGRNVPVGDLNVVHSGWVLKKKRKKMQGKY